MTLQETLSRIRPLDEAAMEECRRRWGQVAHPLGSLGLLEEALIQIAGITGSADIRLEKKAVALFCADNGVVAQGVTQTDSSITALVARSFAAGTSSVCRMAKVAGAEIFPVDVGVAEDLDCPGVWDRKVAYGTGDITQGPAMSRSQAIQAVEAGIETVELLARRGCQVIATGEMGIGNTTTSSAVIAAILHLAPEEVTGRGAGLSTEGLCRKIGAVRRALERNRPDPADGLDVLAKVGGFDLAALAGAFLGGAALHLPVLVDGIISAAGALAASVICPEVKGYLVASHASGEPAGESVCRALGLKPLIRCGMRLGEGTGAVAALPLLEMALAVYQEVGTFADHEMDAYEPLE